MRIALISPPFESVPPKYYGGTERVVYNLCRGLTEAGIDVTLFASGDSSVDVKLVPIIDEAMRFKADPVTDPCAYHLRMLAQVAERAGDFDIIHNHHDYWMLPLSEMTQVPVLTTVHGRMDNADAQQAFLSFPKAYYVSISDSQREPLEQLRWLRTIHHGLDISSFKFHPKKGSYLAFVGRMTIEKRPEWAIQIAKKAGIPLKMAAKIEGPESRAYYDAFVKPHVDGKFIEFVGEIDESEKSEFLGNALASVFPIDWPEPFGLVPIESLACGTPVLARPCGAVKELLADGETGYLSMSINQLARHVKDIEKIDRARCRQWVQDRFSLARMTEDYIHVYRHLAEFAGARARVRARRERRPDRHRRNFLHPVERSAHRDT